MKDPTLYIKRVRELFLERRDETLNLKQVQTILNFSGQIGKEPLKYILNYLLSENLIGFNPKTLRYYAIATNTPFAQKIKNIQKNQREESSLLSGNKKEESINTSIAKKEEEEIDG